MKDQLPVNDIDKLIERVASCTGSKDGESLLRHAYQVAFEAHGGFERINGEPYINHALAVASILVEWRAPLEVVVVGLLHDIINPDYSHERSLERLQLEFEPDIFQLLENVVSFNRFIRNIERNFDEEVEVVNVQHHLASVLQQEQEVVVIKVADRLHNLQTISCLPQYAQKRTARIGFTLLAPLADRLGMGSVKHLLEDHCFEIIDPTQYKTFEQYYNDANMQQEMQRVMMELQQVVNTSQLKGLLRCQSASLYTLYRHQIEKNAKTGHAKPSPFKLADTGSFIILTETVEDCYRALGIIHKHYLPIKGHFRDFIADQKENGYQSLHTQVKHPSGNILDVVIRTQTMDLIADYGVTAHWWGVPEELLPRLLKNTRPNDGEIQVFTPEGAIMYLSQGATVLDFAYHIHTDVGYQCVGALVNGEQAELYRRLQTGDRVEIISGGSFIGPSLYQLDYLQTPQAISRVRHWFAQHRRSDMVQRGRMFLNKELQSLGLDTTDAHVQQLLTKLGSKEKMESIEDLLVSIGIGRHNASKVVETLKSMRMKSVRTLNYVEPIVDVNVLASEDMRLPQVFARCCRPQPPDDIVGYHRSDGILAIHKRGCTQVKESEKLIQVKWSTTPIEPDYVIMVEALNRPGLASEIDTLINLLGINMENFNLYKRPDGVTAEAHIYLGKTTLAQYNRVQKALEGAPYVNGVEVIHSSFLSRVAPQSASSEAAHLSNPYGPRLAEGSRFYGREAECERIASLLRSPSESTAILLWGQKRIGKTSFVLRLKELAQGDFLPVYIDMQGLKDSSTTQFLHELMRGIVYVLLEGIRDLKREVSVPALHRLRKDPLAYFDSFMTLVEEVTRSYPPLVVILDEFQCLCSLREEEVNRNAIFSRLRSRSLHGRGMRLVLSGGGLMSQLTKQGDISSLFNISYDEKLGYLEAKAARRLIKDGLSKVGNITDLAINLLFDLTAGHPFYLQLLCSRLFEQEKEHKSMITQQMVMQNVQEWVDEADSSRFSHLWEGYDATSTQKNKLILCAIAQLTNNEVEYSRLADVLCPTIAEHELIHALEDLTSLGILRRDHLYYAIMVKLLTIWLKHHWPLEVALKEASWL